MSEDARGNKLELEGLVADYRAAGLNVNETEGNTLALQETNFGPRNGEISESVDEDNDGTTTSSTPGRETWANSLDFILSLLGYAVGLGNLWRFPYLCMRNGGGAFLIPFLICLVTCGMPMFLLEVSAGQFSGKSLLDVWCVCPLFKGIGVGMLVISTLVAAYYNAILAWTLYFIINSFKSPLPWTRCDGWWNSEFCFDTKNETAAAMWNNITHIGTLNVTHGVDQGINGSRVTPEEEFWHAQFLRISGGIGDYGSINWNMLGCLFGACILIFLCILKGVRSIGKVVYVTALLPYVLLTILLVKSVSLPGAVDGIVYYLKPDLAKMMTVQVWVEAALQVFYSLGPGWGPLISMASYNKFNSNCLRDGIMIPFLGEGTSIYCGLVVFTILGFVAHEMGKPITEVIESGPGLGFIAYPQALALLPVPQLWSALFFFMLLTVGLDSQFANVEAIVASALDSFPNLRKKRVLVSLGICFTLFLVGVPLFCFQNGLYIFTLMDWYLASIAIPIFGILECLVFGWIYGARQVSRDIEMMIGRPLPIVFRFFWCIVTPAILLLCLVFTLWTYTPVTYSDYNYPAYGEALGWCVACLPVLPIPIVIMSYIWTRGNLSVPQALKAALKPSRDWKPNSDEYAKSYIHDYSRDNSYRGTVVQRVKMNLLGR